MILGKAQELSSRMPPDQFNPLTQTPLGQGLSSMFLQPPKTKGGKLAGLGAELGGFSTGVLNPVASAAVGVVGKGVEFGKDVLSGTRTLLSPQRLMGLGQKARQAVELTRAGAGPALETELAKIPQTVNLRNTIGKLLGIATHPEGGAAQEALSQGLANAAKVGDTTLARLLENPEAASAVSALDAQRVYNTIKQIPDVSRIMQIFGRGATTTTGGKFVQRATQEGINFLHHADTVKAALSKIPEYGQAIGRFAETSESVRRLTPIFAEGKRGAVRNILTRFGGPFGLETSRRVAKTLPSKLSRQIFAVPKAAATWTAAPALATVKRLFGSPRAVPETMEILSGQ